MVESPIPVTPLRIAVPRGNLFEPTLDLLEAVGFDVAEMRANERKLVFQLGEGREVITTRPADVPTYVEYGASDIGIVGKDVLLEHEADVYELLDLGYGGCRIVYAAPGDSEPAPEELEHPGVMRVASKYPKVTRDYFERQGRQVEVIDLRGSIELAPQVGLAEGIVDLTSSGVTLAENNLVELDEIAACSVRMIANRVSYKLKAEMIDRVVRRVQEALEMI